MTRDARGFVPGAQVSTAASSGAASAAVAWPFDPLPARALAFWRVRAALGTRDASQTTDGELIEGSDGLRVIHTPGHSPGHIALHHEPSGTALVGDAVFHRGAVALGPAPLAADPGLRAGSLAGLPRDLTAAAFAHGAPLTCAGVAVFHVFCDKL